MRSVHVDPAAGTARVGAGCELWDVDKETQAARACASRRRQFDDRHRGADARRWLRLDHPEIRHDHRQSAFGRRGDGRRLDPPRQRRTRTRTCSGRSAAAAGISASCRPSSSPLHPVGPQVLSGLVVHPIDGRRDLLRDFRQICDEGAGRADRLVGPSQGAAAALPAGGVARPRGADLRGLLLPATWPRAKRRWPSLRGLGDPIADVICAAPLYRLAGGIRPASDAGRRGITGRATISPSFPTRPSTSCSMA